MKRLEAVVLDRVNVLYTDMQCARFSLADCSRANIRANCDAPLSILPLHVGHTDVFFVVVGFGVWGIITYR